VRQKINHWEDILDKLHDSKPENKKVDAEEDADFSNAFRIKEMLKQVFLFDSFDKKAAKIRIDEELKLSLKVKSMNPFNLLFIRAAVVLVAVLSGALIQSVISNYYKTTGYTELSVPLGQMAQIKLPDGTKAWLNSGTTFRYPTDFEKSSREVYLNGEAFFDVAKDKSKPFVINAKNFSVTVLGTSFNLTAYSDDENSNVTLVEGSILLENTDKKWSKRLSPGQAATINSNSEEAQVASVNTDFYTTWKEGKVVFKAEPFELICKKLERWYNVDIVFNDPSLKQLEFSGTFLKYKPIEQVLRSICIMNDQIDFSSENKIDQKNKIVIKRKPNI